MTNTVADVLAGSAAWACEEADALAWLAGLPDDSVDLLLCSPPYMSARTYGIGFDMDAEKWVKWMLDIVAVASKKVKGLITVVCEGQTRDYLYHPAPFLLEADLYRAGFNVRKPVAYHRVGICGSGGPDWLRNDYESVICVTRPGHLPWSDNTACGHPPKWAPGGEFSNRLSDGTRVNQWGKTVGDGQPTAKARKADGSRDERKRPSHTVQTTRELKQRKTYRDGGRAISVGIGDWRQEQQQYVPPALANPGNTVRETYTADEVSALLAQASDVTHHNVGGGQMGHPSAHRNEAPFPLTLAEFFVKSFCPPGGVAADCFAGSGTTAHAAIEHNRRFIGCDVRASQVELLCRRVRTVTPAFC